MKRARVLVVVGLTIMAAGLGIGLGLSSSGSPSTGTLTGAILDEYGGALGKEASPGPGTVLVHEQGRLVATEGLALGQRFRFRLPPGTYQVNARLYPLLCSPVDASVRSDKVVSVQVPCIGTIG